MSIDKKTHDMLRKSTVKIKHSIFCKDINFCQKSKGTGFICNNPKNGKQYIITAKHVVNIVDIRLGTTSIPFTSTILFHFEDGKTIEIPNPDRKLHKNYDIAALPMNQVILQAQEDKIQLDYSCVSPDKIADYDFIRGKDAIPVSVMSPYAWDNGNPEGRSGKTIVLVNEEPDPLSHFLIDCKCEEMDSGSPVYTNNDNDMVLIGILSGGGKFDYSAFVNQIFSGSNQFPDQHILLESHPNLKFSIPKHYGFCVGSNILTEWFHHSFL